MRISCVSPLHSTFSSRCLPWHACVEGYMRLFLNKAQLFSAEHILLSSARCKNVSPFPELLRKLLLGNSRSSSEFRLVRELQMQIRVEMTRNCHTTWVQVQIPKASLVIDIRLICRRDVLSSLLLKSKVKVLIAMFFSLPLFSIPSFLRNANGIANFLESLCNSSRSRRACWKSKTFPGKLISLVYFAVFQLRGSAFSNLV